MHGVRIAIAILTRMRETDEVVGRSVAADTVVST